MANADIAYRLRNEVERILSAKYPTAMKTLHKILEEQEQNARLIDAFALANPCKLNGLLDVIREQSKIDPSVIDFVLRLSSSRLFSKALIERCPEVAAALIVHAEEDFKRYAQLGVNLISSWHSSSFSLPTDADRFVARLVKSTIDGSSIISLLDVYDCMSASAITLTSTLSTEDVDSFLDHLSTLIKQRAPAKEFERIIGISSLYQFWREQTKATIARKGWEEVAAQLFHSEKIVKAVKLVIADVFLVTRPNSSLSQQEIERTLDAAHAFLSKVKSQELSSWCQLEDSDQYIKKLCAFSSADHLSLSACRKLASLLALILGAGYSKISKSLVLDRLFVCDANIVTSDIGITAEQIQTLFKVFGKHTTKDTITKFLQGIVRMLGPISSEVSINGTERYLKSLLKGLRLAAADDSLLREHIIQWLASAHKDEILSAMMALDISANCAAGTNCAIAAAVSKNLLQIEFSQLLLETITLQSHLGAPKLDVSFSLSIIRTVQLASAPTPFSCAAWQVIRAPPVVLASNIVLCTPTDKHTGQSWPERIRSFAESNSRHLQESITHLVQNTCQDLQDRCEQVEEPLQQERLLRGQAEKALAEVRVTCTTMQSTLGDRDLALADAEAQVCELQQKLTAQSAETTELQDKLQHLQAKMAQKTADHKAEIEQLRATNLDAESSVHKQLSEARDELVICRQELQKEQGNADKLRHELDETTPELRRAQQDASEKKERLTCLETQLVKSKAAASELQENVQALFAKQQELEREASDAQSLCKKSEMQVDTLQRQLDSEKRDYKMSLDLLAEHEGKFQTLEIRYETSMQDHAKEISQLKTKHEKHHEQLESRSREMQQRLEQKIDGLRARIGAQDDELASGRALVSNLEQEIEDLQGVLEEKVTELEALRTWQANLNNVLGAKPATPARTKTLVRKRVEKPSTFKAPRRQTPAPEPIEQSFDDASSMACTVPQALGQDNSHLSPTQPGSADSSFGSIPKAKRQRQKTPVKQSAFKIPMLKHGGQVAPNTVTAGSPSKRAPLQDISRARGNGLSPLRPKSTRRQSLRSSKRLRESVAQLKPMDEDTLEEMISEDFGSEIFTGTQVSQTKLHALTAEQYHDGTTVDE